MPDERARVILLLGGPRGEAVFDEVVSGPSAEHLRVVGVVADYPPNEMCFASGRYWRHPQFAAHHTSLGEAVFRQRLPLFLTSVERGGFKKWVARCKAQCFLLTACGQRLRKRQLASTKGRAVNVHPVAAGVSWKCDRYKGTYPYERMVEDQVNQAELVVHMVDSRFDRGREMWRSGPVDLPKDCSDLGEVVYAMHRAMAPVTVEMVKLIAPLLAKAVSQDVRLCAVLNGK